MYAGEPLSSDQAVGRLLLLRFGSSADQTRSRRVLRGNGFAHDQRDQGRPKQIKRNNTLTHIIIRYVPILIIT